MGKEKFTFRVDEKLLRQMKIFAITINKPLNEVLENAFNYYFNNYEKIISEDNALTGGEVNEQ